VVRGRSDTGDAVFATDSGGSVNHELFHTGSYPAREMELFEGASNKTITSLIPGTQTGKEFFSAGVE